MFGLGRGRPRRGRDMVSTCVVRDENRTALGIAVVGVWQRQEPCPEIGKEHERDTGAPHPRMAAKHRIQLSDTPPLASSVQPERTWAGFCDERLRALNRLPIDVKQHRLARSNSYLTRAMGVDAALTIDTP